ncbi:Uncharacterised protein [Mycobacteroides abscessus subsp. massiliense]|nr:Uncharacterised protein [Mycobacteroides abscessus subsp. massiliense]
MRERGQCRVIGEQLGDACQLRTAGLGVVDGTNGVLHEGVGGDDEEGRRVDPDGHHPDTGQMNQFGQASPSKYPQAQKGRLEEERHQAFQRQGSAEDITDKS